MAFNDIKEFNGQKYSGMPIGGGHSWIYQDGQWKEQKVAPDRWKFSFNCIKRRYLPAPIGSGVNLGTQYHWYILADQMVTKTDKDSYETSMQGLKFKLGHKRPHWRDFSYNYSNNIPYRQRLIEILKNLLEELEEESTPSSVTMTPNCTLLSQF